MTHFALELSRNFAKQKNPIQSNPDNISSEELQDVKAYEELSRQLFLELVDLNNTKERIRESKTLKGRYFNFLGYFFSLYCAYKIIMCTGKSNMLITSLGIKWKTKLSGRKKRKISRDERVSFSLSRISKKI